MSYVENNSIDPSIDKKFKEVSKESISDFNQLEARGWVVERLQQIEYRIDTIIINHFKPENKMDFRFLMLNSSIIDFGGKLKLLYNIFDLDKTLDNEKVLSQYNIKLIEEIRKLVSIRNGFAHAKINETIHLTLEGDENWGGFPVDYIEVMNSKGKLNRKEAKEYLYEFFDVYEVVIKKLDEIIESK